MRPGLPIRIAAAVTLLALGLVGTVVRESIARERGREVALAMGGYDPRSLLGGHYLAFQLLDVGTTPGQCPPGTQALFDPAARGEGWVALRQAGARHRVAGVANSREEARRLGEVVVRGSARCFQRGQRFDSPAANVTAELGIDRFYADQPTAEALGRSLQAGGAAPDAAAIVSVGEDGRARLKAVVIAGRRHDLKMF